MPRLNQPEAQGWLAKAKPYEETGSKDMGGAFLLAVLNSCQT
jgi:hypothetical protein